MKKWLLASCAYLHPVLGIYLAGAGYGWVYGLFFSFISVFVFILLAVFGSKNKPFCFFLVLLNVAATILMVYKTEADGVRYFVNEWNSSHIIVILYFLLWFSWLAIPIISLLRNRQVK